MKIFYLVFALLFSAIATFSQVPNSGFENWTNGEPNDWQTANLPIIPHSLIQDTEAFSGQYCAKGIVVSNNSGQPYAPYLGFSGPAAQGFQISDPYSMMQCYLKLNLNNGDKFVITVHVYNSNHEPIADGKTVISSSTNGWQQFSTLINYSAFDFDMRCAMFFTITDSSELTSGQIGSTFSIDEITMNGIANLGVADLSNVAISAYPNPASDHIQIKVNDKSNNVHCALIDSQGKIIQQKNIFAETDLDVSNIPPGIYSINILTDENNYSRKILVTH